MPERRSLAATRAPDDADRRLINALQGGFPLSERPFAEVAAALGLAEDEVIARLQAMLADRVLTRFGPMYQIERMGGAFCLAALAVPEIRGRALDAGTEPFTNTPQEFAAMIREETKKWAEVIKAGGIRLQ